MAWISQYILSMNGNTNQGDIMSRYIATLTRTIETTCAFESTDCQTGNKIEEYRVPMTLREGTRRFPTMKKAKEWVMVMNRDFGQGTAIFNGKH